MTTLSRIALLAALSFLFALPAWALEVEATGTAAIFSGNLANAKQQALQNAQRNAVEQGVGLVLDARTTSQNFRVIEDEILTASRGFVTKYDILSEGKTRDGRSYEVRIKATVSRELLEDRLSALRILHRKMGNKRVMVIYQSDNPNALARNHGASTAAIQAVQNALNAAGFRVFDPAATDRVYRQIEQAARVDAPVDDIIALSLKQQADIVVRISNVAGQRGKQGGVFSKAYAMIRLSVYDVNTGRQIADSQVEGSQLLAGNPGPYDWERGLVSASEQAAEKASQEVITRVIDYYEALGDQGKLVLIVFRGFDDEQKNLLLDVLGAVSGVQDATERTNTADFMEVELFTDTDASQVRREIWDRAKQEGVELKTQFSSGNRIVFTNPRQEAE